MNTAPKRRQHGLTLIELMVGLTLGMVVATALLTLFANASTNGSNLQRASAHIENGRYAVELLREEVQMAGYYGEISTAASAWQVPNPCATDPVGAFTPAPLALPTPVRGHQPADMPTCLTGRNLLAGTDAVVVRRVEVTPVAVASLPPSGSQYYLQHSLCNSDPVAEPLVFAPNPAAFTVHDRGCSALNTARAYVSRIYFVAACNRCSGSGDGMPTLKRLDLVGNTLVETALVEGVESLRIEYGFDTDANGSADTFLATTAASGPASLWENVVALNVHLVMRSAERVTGSSLARAQTFQLGGLGSVSTANDGYVRRAYSTTVRLINPSGARESQ